MPIEVRNVQDGLGVIITGSGVLTDEEYVGAYNTHLTQDKDKFKKYRYSINDFTAVTKVEVSAKAIKMVAALCNNVVKINPDLVVATITNQGLAFGLSRMSELLRDEEGWESMCFKNREDAESWIKERVRDKYGIDDPTFG